MNLDAKVFNSPDEKLTFKTVLLFFQYLSLALQLKAR